MLVIEVLTLFCVYTILASPPKYVSMDEIMSAAAGVSNLTLAHEIAVDADFKINPVDPPPNRYAACMLSAYCYSKSLSM